MGVMTFYYWWQNYSVTQKEREELISGLSTEQPSMEAPSIEQPETKLLVSSDKFPEPLNQLGTNTEVTEGEPATLNIQTENNEVESESLESADSVINNNESAVEQSDIALAQSSSSGETEEEEVVEHQLVIKITGESCWLSIKGQNNRVLAEKEYKQGEVLTFNDNESYSLVIGAPRNVSVTYLGEEVALRLDGRVARFSLPKNN